VPDEDLAKALKMAHGRTMNFAFVRKGGTGQLLVDLRKIPVRDIKVARQELGGGIVLMGTCTGPLNGMVFEVTKEPPSSSSSILRKVIKEEAGLNVLPEFRVVEGDAEDELQEVELEE